MAINELNIKGMSTRSSINSKDLESLNNSLRELKLADNAAKAIPDRRIPLVMPTDAYVNTSGGMPVVVDGSNSAALSTEQTRQHQKSIKFVCHDADTHQFRYWSTTTNRGIVPQLDASGNATDYEPLSFDQIAEFGMWIHVDASEITQINLEITTGDDADWTRTTADADQPGSLVDGWNCVRFVASAGTTTGWDQASPQIKEMRLVMVTNAAADVYVDSIWCVQRPKASLVFITDFAERYFMDGTSNDGTVTGGLPDLEERNLPCVFATQPGYWDADSSRPTTAEVQALANSEYGHAISFHTFAGEATDSLDEAGLIDYSVQAIQKIKAAGIHFFPMRAAYLQNEAGVLDSNKDALDGYLLQQASYNSRAGWEISPPMDRWNMSRYSIHNRTQSAIDDQFEMLEKTRQVQYQYTHHVTTNGSPTSSEGNGVNIDETDWDYWLTKVDAGISAGWLEVVTPETLFRRHGGRYVNGTGGSYWEWRDSDGAISRVDA